MASYSTMSTIPAADVETEQPLLKHDVKLNVKTVLAGAEDLRQRVADDEAQPHEEVATGQRQF